MAHMRARTGLSGHADLADVSRLLTVTVRNTFLESVEDDDEDFLEQDFGFPRAFTDPVTPGSDYGLWTEAARACSRPGLSARVFNTNLATDLPSSRRGLPAAPGLSLLERHAAASSGDSSTIPDEPAYIQGGGTWQAAGASAAGQPSIQAHTSNAGLLGSLLIDEPLLASAGLEAAIHENLQAASSSQNASNGMEGHPDSCTECQFFFFSPDGCRSGADCRYCHGIHPRKNPKKNRRHMKRFTANGPEEAPRQLEIENQRRIEPPLQSLALGFGVPISNKPDEPVPAQMGQAAAVASALGYLGSFASPPPFSPPAALPTQHLLSYTPDTGGGQPGFPPSLTFIAKVRTQVAAHLNMDQTTWLALENQAKFSVDPALPKGLSLHPHAGHISGTPLDVQVERTVHTVTVSLAQIGAGGRLQKMLPFASCIVAVWVLDLRCFVLTDAQHEVGDGGGSQLTLKFQGN